MNPNSEEVLNYIKTRKGQFSRAAWCRQCGVRKGAPEVKKMTITTVRAGIDYNALSAVEAMRASGELPAEPQPLPWGEWESFPWVITHKDKKYLRLYPTPNANTVSHYFIDGEERSYSDVEQYLLASEKRTDSDGTPLCITIPFDNIIEIY
jgi:hypothetical protein